MSCDYKSLPRLKIVRKTTRSNSSGLNEPFYTGFVFIHEVIGTAAEVDINGGVSIVLPTCGNEVDWSVDPEPGTFVHINCHDHLSALHRSVTGQALFAGVAHRG